MTPLQQMFLGVGGKKKTYIDDLFSTYLWKGTGNATTITNNIDLAGEGGMTWIKNRGVNCDHMVLDTERGATKYIHTNNGDQEATESGSITSFNNNGFSVGGNGESNQWNANMCSWSFRNAPGFFKVVKWTGNGTSGRQIAHGLGSMPGFVMTKALDNGDGWRTLHNHNFSWIFYMNSTNAQGSSAQAFTGNVCDATNLTVTADGSINASGQDYIAYVFAGGESTAAAARSVEFSSGKWLETPTSTDYSMGTGDFCIECWVKPTNYTGGSGPYGQPSNGLNLIFNNSKFGLTKGSTDIALTDESDVPLNQWTHVAATRSSGTIKLFINGTCKKTVSNNNNLDPDSTVGIYVGYGTSAYLTGSVSNLRVVKGSAVYTDSFKPLTEPLTNITNTKLLCCNSSTAGGSTVGTINAYSNPPVSDNSPFLDPAGLIGGNSGKEPLIKCGSYLGNESGQKVFVGFEPQWLMIKNATAAEGWLMVDSMRGIRMDAEDNAIEANDTAAESVSNEYIELTTDGFDLIGGGNINNDSAETYIYVAIRRPDGYVGKPADAGTDVFQMDTGLSKKPNFDSGFPVDFAFARPYASSSSWYACARQMTGKSLILNSSNAQGTQASFTFDDSEGWDNATWGNTALSWMFKRHAGFDEVHYSANGDAGIQIRHSLGKAPEMIIIKNRNSATPWTVGHKGLNGGTDPWNRYIFLTDSAEAVTDSTWYNTAPTSTHFTLGNYGGVNDTDHFIALLFASVNGISKVGFYDGSDSNQTITTGFQPRFIIIKNCTNSAAWSDWMVFDSERTLGSGNEGFLHLNDTDAEVESDLIPSISSTGFTVGTNSTINYDSDKFIYYAHA